MYCSVISSGAMFPVRYALRVPNIVLNILEPLNIDSDLHSTNE
jgi:hypothetical protein